MRHRANQIGPVAPTAQNSWRRAGRARPCPAGNPRRRASNLIREAVVDRSETEVADLLGISVGTVKSTASRAIAHLREFPGLAAIFITTDSVL
jgi:DNA-directed RNA polymerase specialized sigma24 family protein